MNREKRSQDGNSFEWTMFHKRGEYESISQGRTFDNLGTKQVSESDNLFEEIFIRVRDVLLDDTKHKNNKFDACHQIARDLSKDLRKK